MRNPKTSMSTHLDDTSEHSFATVCQENAAPMNNSSPGPSQKNSGVAATGGFSNQQTRFFF